MTTEVATAPSNVPALRSTPAVQITAEDIQLSRVYIGQFMSSAVQDQLVKAGDVYVAAGQDDPDPQVAWKFGSKDEGLLVHVLSLRKGKSLVVDGELMLFDFDDPDAPADANVTYNYSVALPEVDTDLPFRWLLTRSGTAAARKINTVLAKNAISGPPWATAFRVTSAARENSKGKYYVAQVKPVEPDKASVEAADQLASIVAAQPAAPTSDANAPAI